MLFVDRRMQSYLAILAGCLCLAAGECTPDASSEDEPAGVDEPAEEVVEEEELGELVSLYFLNPVEVLEVGRFRQLLVSGLYESGTTQAAEDVAWESDAPEVLSVQDGRVSALALGNARILARVEGHEAFLDIQVLDFSPIRIDVQPSPVTLDWESEVILSAAVYGASGLVQDAQLVWQSRDPQVATVTARGRVEGQSAGETVISVTHGALVAEVDVVVVHPRLHEIVVVPEIVGLVIGASEALTVQGRTEQGNPRPLEEVTYTSLNRAVAEIDANGVVTATGNGETSIMVRSGDITATVPVLVDPAHHRIVFSGPCSKEYTNYSPSGTNSDNWLLYWTYDEQGRDILHQIDRGKTGNINSTR
ncbi:MAG: Ig-like domain-containing protein, partial [Bradymonadaceae bacterium]